VSRPDIVTLDAGEIRCADTVALTAAGRRCGRLGRLAVGVGLGELTGPGAAGAFGATDLGGCAVGRVAGTDSRDDAAGAGPTARWVGGGAAGAVVPLGFGATGLPGPWVGCGRGTRPVKASGVAGAPTPMPPNQLCATFCPGSGRVWV
jgi:hypothetical protein